MKKQVVTMSLILLFLISGCQPLEGMKKNQLGTLLGAGAGGAAGYVWGGKNKKLYALAGIVAGGWIGNKIGQSLEETDQEQLTHSSQTAIKTGKTQTWKNPETNVSGQVEVVDEKRQEKQVKVQVLKDRVEEVPPLDIVGEKYKLKANTNLRGGPGKDYKVISVLNSGAVVDAIGQVQGKPWMMVGLDQVGSGFVHASLLVPAPQDSENTAFKDDVAQEEVTERNVVASTTCRTIQQTVTLEDGTVQEEEITACRGPNGWETI